MAGEWTKAMLGTRSRLLGAVAAIVVLILVVPVVLVVFGLYVPAAISVLVGLLALAGVVLALLPGRHRWR